MFSCAKIIRWNSILFLSSVILMFNLCNADSILNTQDSTNERFITWNYKETPMGLYLPAKTDNPLPVVMFLHGCHNDPISPFFWLISALNEIEPCAVFLPTAPETPNTQYSCADWGGTYDSSLRPQMIDALHELDSLINQYGFDNGRQYLYGESMGGEGVYRLLMDFPTRFAGAVDAAGYTLNKGAEQMAKTPLWIFIGSDDEMSPVDSSKAIYNSILNAGGSMVKYTEYPGLGHVSGIEQARTEPGLIEWLLSQKRSSGTIQKSRMKNSAVSFTPRFSYRKGNLYVSSRLPYGTILTLFDMNGKILFKTKTVNKIISIPSAINGRVALWYVKNSRFAVSGKVSLY